MRAPVSTISFQAGSVTGAFSASSPSESFLPSLSSAPSLSSESLAPVEPLAVGPSVPAAAPEPASVCWAWEAAGEAVPPESEPLTDSEQAPRDRVRARAAVPARAVLEMRRCVPLGIQLGSLCGAHTTGCVARPCRRVVAGLRPRPPRSVVLRTEIGPGRPPGRRCSAEGRVRCSRLAPGSAPQLLRSRGITQIRTAHDSGDRLKNAREPPFPARTALLGAEIGRPGPGAPRAGRNVNVPSQRQRTFLPSFWG